MRIEISKPTLDYLQNKYPQLTENIIKYFLVCGYVDRKNNRDLLLNKFEYIFHHYYVLKIPSLVAREFGVEEELDLIPNDEGVIYRIYLNE